MGGLWLCFTHTSCSNFLRFTGIQELPFQSIPILQMLGLPLVQVAEQVRCVVQGVLEDLGLTSSG